jgi:hypothetical protein
MLKIFVKLIVCLVTISLLPSTLVAQTRLAVDIDDPVYTLIEIGEVKGILTKISQIKPYSRKDVYTLLSRMKAREYELSPRERTILNAYLDRFATSFVPTPRAGLTTLTDGSFVFGNQAGHARLGIRSNTKFQFAVEDLNALYASIPLEAYVEGDFANAMFSYHLNIVFNSGKNSPFPYAHHGQRASMGMGFWMRLLNQPTQNEVWDNETMNYWAQALETSPEIAGQFWNDRVLFRLGTTPNREIGTGLLLSRDAAPYNAIELAVRPTDWFNFYYSTGFLTGGRNTLGNDNRDTEFHNDLLVQNSKMFSLHVGEFFISDYFYLNVWESVIWGSRAEAAYLIPVNIFLFAQNLIGDHDNIAFGASAASIIPNIGKFEASIFIDEFQGKNIATSPRNMLAWDVGMRLHFPWLAFSQFRFKYTNIGPYVYSHYPQNYAQFGQNTRGDNVLIDTGYNNRGKGLGSFLKPNSDEFAFAFDTLFMPGLSLSLGYSLVRHGNSAPHKYWLGKDGRYYTDEERDSGAYAADFFDYGQVWAWDRDGITGETNGWLDYRRWDELQWQRNFLKDGIYDWTNSVSIKATYDLRFLPLGSRENPITIPVIIGFGYTFAHTSYNFNGRDFSHIDPVDYQEAMNWAKRFGYSYNTNVKNILTFTVSLYPR